jgi:MFS family permease
MIENEDDERLQHYLDLIYEEVTLEEFKEAKRLPEEDLAAERATFFDPVAESHNRRLIMASGIVFFNQLSGGAALGNFGGNVSFLSVAGSDPESLLSVFVYLNLLQVVVTLFSGQFLEKYGRRAFMMEGQRIIIVSLLLIAFIEIFVPSLHIFTVILTFIQMVGFSVCYGPCSFLIGTEILHDIFYPSVFLWIFIFVNSISVGTFVDALGIGPLCLIYCGFQIWGFLYISGYLVETQGRNRRDVYADFRKGIFPNPIRYLHERIRNNKQQGTRDIELPLVENSQVHQ